MEEIRTKQCSSCNQTKKVYEFGVCLRAKDGLTYHCSECIKKDRYNAEHEIIRRNGPNASPGWLIKNRKLKSS